MERWATYSHTGENSFVRAHACVNTTQTIFWREGLFVWNEDHHQVRSIVFHPHRSLPDFPHPALADSQKPASYCCAMQVLSPASNCPPLVEVEDLYMVIIRYRRVIPISSDNHDHCPDIMHHHHDHCPAIMHHHHDNCPDIIHHDHDNCPDQLLPSYLLGLSLLPGRS